MTRQQKIDALKGLQAGITTLAEVVGELWQFGASSNLQPGIFTNEQTGEQMTASQLKARQQARPWIKLFEEIKTY